MTEAGNKNCFETKELNLDFKLEARKKMQNINQLWRFQQENLVLYALKKSDRQFVDDEPFNMRETTDHLFEKLWPTVKCLKADMKVNKKNSSRPYVKNSMRPSSVV